MRKQVTILGGRGMLGADLADACDAAGWKVYVFDLPELDIRDFAALREHLPLCDWVVNCAAYTRVDDAESDRAAAFAVNAEGALNVARVCARKGLRLLHISTDYIFDGRKGKPYAENDVPAPLNVYGASKLAGEKAVRAEGGSYLIVRTQSLFGRRGVNFVRTIVEKIRANVTPIQVVYDQVSCPTYTRHLAQALVQLMQLDKRGVVHVSAAGSCSWYEFARSIAEELHAQVEILPIASEKLARPATRPAYSVLDNSLFVSWTGSALPHWRVGLQEYLKEEGWL